MNRLKELRESLKISIRELSSQTGISYTVLSYLENEKRNFRQCHIDTLIAYFDVTSDYLLGKGDYGVIVYRRNDNDALILSDGEYKKLYKYITFKVLRNNLPLELKIKTKNEINVLLPEYSVFRELNYNDDQVTKDVLKNKVIDLLNNMDINQLDKTIKFIEQYIKE